MTESESVALPLGDTPLTIKNKNYITVQKELQVFFLKSFKQQKTAMKKPVPNYKGDEEKEEQGSGRVMFFEKENRSKEYFAPTYKSKIK